MTALLVGRLVECDGCLWVESVHGENAVLPDWPPEFALGRDGERMYVSDGQGTRVSLGDEARMGGGHVPGVDDAILDQIPLPCRGAYFVVGEGFGPDLIQDSELVSVKLLPNGEHPALFLGYKPTFLSMLAETPEITGTLVHYGQQRCVQLETGSGPRPTTLLLPYDWSMRMEGGGHILLGPDGKVIARKGDALRLSGRGVAQDWESEIYRRAVTEMLADCCCTFFLVEAVR